MKIEFEHGRGRIRDMGSLEEALHILEYESKQGFFRSNVKSYFKKYNTTSIVEDAKSVELHVAKVYGKGEYKLVGNLSYNHSTKQVKFYIVNVFKNEKFNYEIGTMFSFINENPDTKEETLKEYKEIINSMKEAKPKGEYRAPKYNSKRTPNPKRMEKSETAKKKTEKNFQKKNFKTDQRRNVANNKKSSW